MVAYTRKNALDQALDIAGSLLQSATKTLTDEPAGYGQAVSGQTGADGYVTAVASGVDTFVSATAVFSAQSVGKMLTLVDAAHPGNTGTFLIVAFNSSVSVDISNANPGVVDAVNPIVWTERDSYTLEDDVNFVRTDRKLIKGTTNFYDAVPTYTRPTNTLDSSVPANLTNIAGKTLDAHAWVVNRLFHADPVLAGDGYSTISGVPGTFPYADAVDRTGVPVWDGFDAGNWETTYVEIIDPSTSNYLVARGGVQDGYRIFGRTRQGTTGVEGTSIEVEFFAVPFGDPISSSATYAWDATQPNSVDYYYGFRERADNLTETAFRTTLTNGLFADTSGAVNTTNINNILTTIGTTVGNTYLTGLTNTGTYFPFNNLPDATPSVTEAFNTLNSQIGNRTYTGGILSDGYTITASLQQLATALSAANFVRVVERLASDIPANTAHTLPSGSYTLDPSHSGQNLVVYTRGLLRDPGPVAGNNDYAETSSTSVTFYSKQKAGDHINYFIYA